MAKRHTISHKKILDQAAHRARRQKYVLQLYIAGLTSRSREALRTVIAICEEELAGRCDLEVIDLYREPSLAQKEQIVAMPTLIRKLPKPPLRFIGSMADRQKLLAGLDVIPRSP
ncbi:MAG: circadian clock KaiB family protein [Planctomycetaceae bacterium]|nr:circadian clock KaiB family protein [Planctomycetaceae bacterium]